MLKKLKNKLIDLWYFLLREENSWMWSVIAICALCLTALLLIFHFFYQMG